MKMPNNGNRTIDIEFEGKIYKNIPYDKLVVEFRNIGVEIGVIDCKGAQFIASGEIQNDTAVVIEDESNNIKKKRIIKILKSIIGNKPKKRKKAVKQNCVLDENVDAT